MPAASVVRTPIVAGRTAPTSRAARDSDRVRIAEGRRVDLRDSVVAARQANFATGMGLATARRANTGRTTKAASTTVRVRRPRHMARCGCTDCTRSQPL
jgi:hypothetical protein